MRCKFIYLYNQLHKKTNLMFQREEDIKNIDIKIRVDKTKIKLKS